VVTDWKWAQSRRAILPVPQAQIKEILVPGANFEELAIDAVSILGPMEVGFCNLSVLKRFTRSHHPSGRQFVFCDALWPQMLRGQRPCRLTGPRRNHCLRCRATARSADPKSDYVKVIKCWLAILTQRL
jgi:hypothetical protein